MHARMCRIMTQGHKADAKTPCRKMVDVCLSSYTQKQLTSYAEGAVGVA